MVRLYTLDAKPLRVYIEGDQLDIQRLTLTIKNKYYKETDYSKEDDLDTFIFTEDSEYYFPVGLLSLVMVELNALMIQFESTIVPKKDLGTIAGSIEDNLLEGITLREYQVKAIESALTYKKGLIKIATGGGKTSVMTGICRYLLDHAEGHMLVCVPTANLLHQTYESMVSFGISPDDISLYGDGYILEPEKRICIATVATTYRKLCKDYFREWYKDLTCIMFDEAQHIACRTWYTVLDTLAPEYAIGLSAEPIYGDSSHMIRDLILRGSMGPIIHNTDMKYLVDRGYLSKPYVIAINSNYAGNIYQVMDWQVVNKSGVIQNKSRNTMITDSTLKLLDAGKNPLILVSQIKHGDLLARMISQSGRKVAMMTGGLKTTLYMNGMDVDSFKDPNGDTKKQFQDGMIDVLIGTSTMDEGVDIPSIGAIILAGAGKNQLKLVQRIGRSLRIKPNGDNTTMIIDFQDKFSVVLHSQFKKRKAKIDSMLIPVYYCNDMNNFTSLVNSIMEQHNKEVQCNRT